VRFIEAHRARFGAEQLCRVLGMAPSTYYYHRARLARPVRRRERDRELLERITAIWVDSRFTYGSPRVHAQLARQGIRVGRKRVERLMREAGLRGAYRSRYFRSTESDPSARVAPDLVDRDFHATAPNQLWVADFTYLRIDNAILFLACVLDVFSRAVVGWNISDVRDTALVDDALTMALNRRGATHGLVHHSDRGSQYTSYAFGQHLIDADIAASMGSKGDAYDNAMIESFFGTLKVELIDRRRWHTRGEVSIAALSYIEGWYNPRRLQRALGWRSPLEFEAHHLAGHDLNVLATAQGAPVLTDLKAQPCGRPTAGLDLSRGRAPNGSRRAAPIPIGVGQPAGIQQPGL
jgi:transposase InsO family protein